MGRRKIRGLHASGGIGRRHAVAPATSPRPLEGRAREPVARTGIGTDGGHRDHVLDTLLPGSAKRQERGRLLSEQLRDRRMARR